MAWKHRIYNGGRPLKPGDTWSDLIGMTIADAKTYMAAQGYVLNPDLLTIDQGGAGEDEVICDATVDGPATCCGYLLAGPRYGADRFLDASVITLTSCSTDVAVWDYEAHGAPTDTYDTTGTYDSNLELTSSVNCPNGTACGWANASHRATDSIPVTAGASYVFSTDIKWFFDPAIRDVYINYDGGSGVQQMLVDGSAGYSQGVTYTVSTGFVVPAGKTHLAIWFSPYSGITVDNMKIRTA